MTSLFRLALILCIVTIAAHAQVNADIPHGYTECTHGEHSCFEPSENDERQTEIEKHEKNGENDHENQNLQMSPPMSGESSVLIVSASSYGLSHKIAGSVLDHLKGVSGIGELVHIQAEKVPQDFTVDHHKLCFLISSVKMGGHNSDMVDKFVNKYLKPLNADMRPAIAQLTVGLGPADMKYDPDKEHAEQMYTDWEKTVKQNWIDRTGIEPTYWRGVAGSLAYTDYNFLVRWLMKGISKSKGFLPTDTSKNYDYTDYDDVYKFVDECVSSVYGK